jgi:glycosyltransferase involved in cell wall biosynthesis
MKIIDFDPDEIISRTRKENHALAVGKFEKVQGFDLLIRSWVDIKRELIIIGDGPECKTLKELIKSLNLDNKINLKNFMSRENVLQELAKAKVFILSSIDDSGTQTALEALALNTPVLSTNVGCMDSIFPDELLVKPNNQAMLKEFLDRYVDDIDFINQKSIFKYVLEEFYS